MTCDWHLGDRRSIGFVATTTALSYLSVVVGARVSERRTLIELTGGTSCDFAVSFVGAESGRP